MKKIVPIVILFLILTCLSAIGMSSEKSKQEECFNTSLHHTTRGMKFWYESKGGLGSLLGVKFKDQWCKKCHAATCNDCHLEKTDSGLGYSVEVARRDETCFKCHSREQATPMLDDAAGTPGVHAGSMGCMDCHTAREVHGDGTCYESMRAPGVMDVTCERCHGEEESAESTPMPATRSHTVHGDKLDCSACHVSNSMSCYNCHLGELEKTGKKSESFAGMTKDFMLLVKYNGKVVSGTVQTLVTPKDDPFVFYVPYFTHSIMGQGRTCEECHGIEAVKKLSEGEQLIPARVESGKVVFHKGVLPLASSDQFKWPFLKKQGGVWKEFTPKNPPRVQLGVYAEPLSAHEMKMMNTHQKYDE